MSDAGSNDTRAGGRCAPSRGSAFRPRWTAAKWRVHARAVVRQRAARVDERQQRERCRGRTTAGAAAPASSVKAMSGTTAPIGRMSARRRGAERDASPGGRLPVFRTPVR
ncbi:MAG: hypothetical protein M0C28_16445 [Candidatus Moduliflexus flocculans]|nr:hypothetical protein [Candidatus Moduliflexus flocculans]